jgi:hypothetical protein
MTIVGGLFEDEPELTMALETLQDHGFDTFTVLGPEELFKEQVVDEDTEERLESPQHTAAGVISGITVNPRTYHPDDASAQSIEDDLEDFGLSKAERDFYVAGLQQNKTALLVKTRADRADEAREVLQQEGATLPS